MKEAKKVKEKTLAKEKLKEMFETKSPQEAAGHNSGPLKTNHTIVDQSVISSERKFRTFKWSSEQKIRK